METCRALRRDVDSLKKLHARSQGGVGERVGEREEKGTKATSMEGFGDEFASVGRLAKHSLTHPANPPFPLFSPLQRRPCYIVQRERRVGFLRSNNCFDETLRWKQGG